NNRVDEGARYLVKRLGNDLARLRVAFRRQDGAHAREARTAPGKIVRGGKSRQEISPQNSCQALVGILDPLYLADEFQPARVHRARVARVDRLEYADLVVEMIGDA